MQFKIVSRCWALLPSVNTQGRYVYVIGAGVARAAYVHKQDRQPNRYARLGDMPVLAVSLTGHLLAFLTSTDPC